MATDLVSAITSKEEQDELLKRADELINEGIAAQEQAVEDKDGFMQIPLVKPMKDATPSVEERQFLILFFGEDKENEDAEFRYWDFVTGRKAAYYAIKDMLLSDYVSIDLYESYITVELDPIKKRLTLYDFMMYVIEKDLIDDEENYIDISQFVA